MLIYILHKNEIFTFRLPKNVMGSYVLTDQDERGRIRDLVNISAKDGKWIISSNDEVFLIYNNKNVENMQLQEYCFYNLQYLRKENIFLYVLPGNETNYKIFSIAEQTTLLFGNDSKCDAVFLSQNVGPKQFELKNNGGIWEYKNLNPNTPIYINKKRNDSSYLYNFDNLFVMGLHIILLKNKILISTPPGTFDSISNKLLPETKQFVVPDNKTQEIVKDFYDEGDYFSKSPIFRKKISEYDMTITGPEIKQKGNESSIVFSLVPSGLMSITSLISAYYTIQNYNAGKVEKESFVSAIAMCVVMLVTGVVWPLIEYVAGKIKFFITERLRVHNYKKYLKRKRKQLQDIITEQKAIFEFNNLPLEECQRIIEKRNTYLFSRNTTYESFLSLKFGTGNIESNIQFDYKRPDLIIDNEKLLDNVDQLIDDFKYINEAPFSISLKNSSLGVVNNNGYYDPLLNVLIIQLITLHDYKNLKLIVLTSEFSSLNKIKNLNHCWSDDKTYRYFANNLNDAENISSELIKIYNQNIQQKQDEQIESKKTYYLIISDCIEKYKSLSLIERIMMEGKTSNFSLLMFGNNIAEMPTGCTSFVVYNEREASFFHSEMEDGNTFRFKPEFIGNTVDFERCISLLSNIPIKLDSESQGLLPDKLGFLEMYGVGNLEQLNIINKWNTSAVVSSLAAPIGVDSNGNILTLDLHEKKHGPHGLIAGMTGSGKSEFIVTYILSLAINYSPDEVQFVLIDYKGGGLAGAFENRKTGIKLPHLVGTITNLDKSEMNRTLVSIKSELQRRQRKFNEAKELLNTGSIDIYKYQSLVREGTLKESMSHLFIICDEFAELKAQQPDFMDELVSAARIGRSLGIHLILATQKPSGVVDDQIWSNSKFKVCCKVQTAEDSKEMIRREDAAFLKEAGRFYLLVGYDQYFVEGQSGYSGVQYVPSTKAISKLDNSLSFINNVGDIYKNVTKKEEKNSSQVVVKLGEELNNILKYIVDIANENNYEYHQLWLDNVPKVLYYSDLTQKYKEEIKPFDINPIIGEYDDPENQSQGSVTLPITTNGNTIILGISGMGKNTLLSTIVYSTMVNHRPDEVNFYIVDFGSEKLKKFSKSPQVGDVLSINDEKKINYLFYMLDAEIEKRRNYYSNNGGDFSLDVKNGKSVFPNVIVIIYGMEAFRENFDDVYEEQFSSITRNCSKFGVNFIITGSSTSSIGFSIENNFPQKVILNMMDPGDYKLYFDNAVAPSKNPGRGLIAHNDSYVEFQTSILFEEDEEKQKIDYVIGKLNEIFKNRAKSVPMVPKRLQYNYLKQSIKNVNSLPLGINIVTAQIGCYDFSQKVNLLTTSKMDVFSKFIGNLLYTMSLCNDNNVIVLNAIESLKFKVAPKLKYYDSNFKKILPVLFNNISKINENASSKKFTIVVLGYSNLNGYMNKEKDEDGTLCNVDDLIINVKNDSFKFTLFDEASLFKNILNGNISDLVDNQNGVWVGNDFDSQYCLAYENISFMNNITPSNDTVVIVKDSIPEYLKFPTL